MDRKTSDKADDSRCELMTNPEKRKAANKATDSIKDALPAGLSRPALRALASVGYTNMAKLSKAREAELSALHGMGPKGIRIIKAALEKEGKSLG